MSWFVYIIECNDKKLYAGITNDLSTRIKEHNGGYGCRFTKYRRPVKLLRKKEFPTKAEALKCEKKIKGLTREKKLNLLFDNRRPSAYRPQD